ncbi:hypothetical protein GGS26DRAFT_551196 [Hypomontagnella submonticulosa]|nr:hypothetical protein GGS26DRAFT_551196 [Hypomontagnella submonticulosa]
MAERASIEAAVGNADLHFPGEDRIRQNRAISSIGVISSRTRARCGQANHMGFIERHVPRYDEEGTLMKQVEEVFQIRWNGSDIQCQVALLDQRYIRDEVAWEDLRTILHPWKEWKIRGFYRGALRHSRAMEYTHRLAHLEGKVPPREVFNMIRGLGYFDHDASAVGNDATSKRSAFNHWTTLLARWEHQIQDAKAHIEAAEAREEERQKRAGEKAKRKAEAEEGRAKKKAKIGPSTMAEQNVLSARAQRARARNARKQ